MLRVNEELALFDPVLARKPQLIALNKIDLPEVQERLEDIKGELSGAGVKANYISAATGQGVSGLMAEAMKVLKAEAAMEKKVELPGKVFRPQPREPRVKVVREGDEYVIHAPDLERIIAGAGVTPSELRWQLNYQLNRIGANKTLEKAGAKTGDKIRCGELTWEY
jgi:GTP-binding protein